MNLYEKLTCHYQSDTKTVLVDAKGDNWSLSCLEECAALCHQALLSQGVTTGDRVMAQVSKSPYVISLYLCCLRAGFVLVPLNTAYNFEELSYFLQDADPAILILDDLPHNAETFSVPVASLSSLARLDSVGGPTPQSVAQPEVSDSLARAVTVYHNLSHPACDALACIIYTSGTTGRAKGAALTHDNLLANGSALSRAWGFSDQDVLLHALPVFHVHGLLIALNTALLGGAEIRFLKQFDVAAVLSALRHCTVMMGVPTYYARLLAAPGFTSEKYQHLRLFISGSAPLSVELFDAFYTRTGHTILERYGMSETNIITSNPLRGERIAGTVGFALEGNELRIVNDKDQELPVNHTGAVQVRGPSVLKAYWRNPQASAAEFTTDRYFRTGDLGQLDGSGRLTLMGRSKDLVISGGLNVYPAEIERVLDAMPGVTESAVIGVPDPDFGERVEAFIVSDGSVDNLDKILLESVRRELANFKRPKAFHLIESLPRNTMGKVQKVQLREQLA